MRSRLPIFSTGRDQKALGAAVRERMKTGNYDLVLYFPPGFAKRLDDFHSELAKRAGRPELAAAPLPTVPSPEVFHDSVKEKSQVALARVSQIVVRWQDAIGARNLRDSNCAPVGPGKPFEFSPTNLAEQKQKEAALWAKILPFVLLLWALTGAFYPAIDLCAGEKERGTLETLLCSPGAAIGNRRRQTVGGDAVQHGHFDFEFAEHGRHELARRARIGELGDRSADWPAAVYGDGVATVGAGAGTPPLFGSLCLALAVFAR